MGSYVYTRKVIAELLNLSEKRIKQLTQEGIIEEFGNGCYQPVPTIQGYVKYLQSQISDDDATSNYNTEKAKLTKVKREDAELELKVKRNELVAADNVEFVMTNILVAFRSRLNTLPYKVLPTILNTPDSPEKKEIVLKALKDAVAEALNELSAFNLEALFDEENYLASLDDTVTGESSEETGESTEEDE